MENHSYGQVIGSSAAPYENSLARACGLATNYHGVTHPSLPNYMAATGGTTAGITTDCSPSSSCESRGPSIFGEIASSGRQWRSYEESMPSNCDLRSAGEYAVKHNPWAYFADAASVGNCRRFDVPMGTTTAGALRSDVVNGRLPNVGMAIPETGYLIVRITKLVEGQPAAADKQFEARAAGMQGAADYEAYVSSLKGRADISINSANLEKK